jgi:hypothetical protein
LHSTQSYLANEQLFSLNSSHSLQIDNSSLNLSVHSTISADFVYKQLPDSGVFNFGDNTPIGLRCYVHHRSASKDSPAQLCRIGKDQTSPPSYFLFGDSYAMVMFNVFSEIEVPGMFAAHNGMFCPSTIRPNMSSTPSKIQDFGKFRFTVSAILFFLLPQM